jgi:hypothetical protein
LRSTAEAALLPNSVALFLAICDPSVLFVNNEAIDLSGSHDLTSLSMCPSCPKTPCGVAAGSSSWRRSFSICAKYDGRSSWSSCLRVRSICSTYAGRNRRSICRCRRSVMSITFECSIFGRAKLLAIAARSAALLARRLAWSSSRRSRIASRSRSSPVVPFPARRS